MFNLWRYIGLRHLTERPLRTILTLLGVTLGFSLFVAIRLINESTLAAFEENVRSVTGNAVLTVTGGEAGFPEDKLPVIEKVSGVKSAVPLLESRAYLVGKDATESLIVFGIDMLREGSVRKYQGTQETPVEDFLTFLNQPDSLVVTKTFAETHQLKLDSPLKLMTAHGLRQFTVRGFLSPTGPAKAYGGNLAIMDIDGARMMFGKEGKIDRVDVTTTGETSAAALTALQTRLEEALGRGYRVAKPESQAESMQRMVEAFQKFLSFISTLAIAIGLFMVGNTISVSVTEKRTEIGSLRALGTTKAGILQLFLGEAALIGAIGGFFGALLGAYLARKLGSSVAQSMSQRFLTQISEPTIHFGARNLLRAIFLGAGVAALAGLRPSRHATKIQPIEAIRRNAEPVQEAGARWLVRLFIGGCAAFVLLVGFIFLERVVQAEKLEGIVQILVLFVINLTAPLFAYWLFRLVRALIVKAESAVGRLALENLLRSPKRTTGNILVLKVGLILFVTIATVHHSFRNSITSWLDRVLQSDLVISSYGDIASFQTQPLHEEVKQSLTRLPQVSTALAAPVRAMRFLHLGLGDAKVALKAYDEPEPELHYSIFDVRGGDTVTAGRALFHGPDPAILLSMNLATRLKKKAGALIALETPHGMVSFRVAGVINDFTSGDGVIVMDRARYRQYWGDPLINLIYLKLKPGVRAEAVRNAIDAGLGASQNLQVTMNQDLKDEVGLAIDRSFSYLHAIEVASLSIALLALLNTLLISIIERRRELGLLRAAGMSRPQLFGMIMTESIVMGIIAVSISIGMGALLSALWVTHSLESLLGWSVPYSFPVTSVLWAAVLGVSVCLLSAIYPAGRAAFLPITEAVANE